MTREAEAGAQVLSILCSPSPLLQASVSSPLRDFRFSGEMGYLRLPSLDDPCEQIILTLP